MLQDIADGLGVSVPGLIALALLVDVQLGLQIYALVDLARRRTVAGGKKWVWALVIVFGQLVGAIVYLAAGRPPAPVAEPADSSDDREPTADRAEAAADLLYGPRERP